MEQKRIKYPEKWNDTLKLREQVKSFLEKAGCLTQYEDDLFIFRTGAELIAKVFDWTVVWKETDPIITPAQVIAVANCRILKKTGRKTPITYSTQNGVLPIIGKDGEVFLQDELQEIGRGIGVATSWDVSTGGKKQEDLKEQNHLKYGHVVVSKATYRAFRQAIRQVIGLDLEQDIEEVKGRLREGQQNKLDAQDKKVLLADLEQLLKSWGKNASVAHPKKWNWVVNFCQNQSIPPKISAFLKFLSNQTNKNLTAIYNSLNNMEESANNSLSKKGEIDDAK